MAPAEGDIIANRFRLVRELGHGGMGSVWLAHHMTLEVPCAVKFLADEVLGDSRCRAQFHIEARAIAQVQSPHVVRVLDHDVSDEGPYIAMELLVGEDLQTRLARVGRLDSLATCRIVSQAARGLSKVHAAGIVHHDLKPENVFLAREDDDEVVKLLDFGIAKLTAFSLVEAFGGKTGALIGTPQYMSPEQAHGSSDVDFRSDLWSLAVITYRCLTGRLPFDGSTPLEVACQVMCSPIPVPSQIAPDLSPEFDGWWARAALRNVDGRFQSAPQLATALGKALGVAEAKSHWPGYGDGLAPRSDAPPRRFQAGDASSTHSGPSETRPASRGKVLVTAGALMVVTTLVPGDVRSAPSMARVSVAAPRAAAVAAAFDSAGPVRLMSESLLTRSEVRVGAAALARVEAPRGQGNTGAGTLPTSARAEERFVKPGLRPLSTTSPRPEPPPSDQSAGKAEGEVDFGI